MTVCEEDNMKKKCNVFVRFVYSFIPSKYGTLAYQSGGSNFFFMLLLSLLMTVSIVFSVFFVMNKFLVDTFGVKTVGELIEKNIPDFTIENGKLDMEEPLNYTVDKVCFLFDSDVEEISMSDVDYLIKNSGFQAIFIGSKTNVFLYNGQSGEMSMAKYSDMFSNTFTKADFIAAADKWTSVSTLGPLLGGIMVVYHILGLAIKVFIYCIIFLFFNLFLRRNVKFGKVYAMSIYAVVPAILLEELIFWLPISVPSEIMKPIYIILTIVLGCFGLFSVHDVAALETEEKFKYKFDQNPYRISGVTPGDAGVISDEDFGGYATADMGRPSYRAVNGNTKVRLKGIEVEHSDLELINKYVKGNLKDLAVQQLGEITGFNIQDCREIIDDWDRYYY